MSTTLIGSKSCLSCAHRLHDSSAGGSCCTGTAPAPLTSNRPLCTASHCVVQARRQCWWAFPGHCRGPSAGKVHRRNTLEQLKLVGPRSLGVALLTASFVGMVFTIQFVREFAKLGLTRSVGGVLALALSRELTPVVTCIILAGELCSPAYRAAKQELGSCPPGSMQQVALLLAGRALQVSWPSEMGHSCSASSRQVCTACRAGQAWGAPPGFTLITRSYMPSCHLEHCFASDKPQVGHPLSCSCTWCGM